MAMLTDLQKMVAGMFMPASSTRNPQNVSGSIYDMARRDAQNQALARIGGGLMAAAVPQTPLMRAQALQGAFSGMGDVGTGIYNSAQVRLLEQKQKAQADQLAADAAWNEKFAGAYSAPIAATTAPVNAATQSTGSISTPVQQNTTMQPTSVGLPPETGVSPTASAVPQYQQTGKLNEFGLTDQQHQWLLSQPPSSRRELAQRFAMQNLNDRGTKYGDPKEVMLGGKRVLARFPETGGEPIVVGDAPPDTPQGWTEYDKKIVPEIIEWSRGGNATIAAQMSQLQFVEKLAQDNPNITGPRVGVIDSFGVLKFTNPEAETAKNTVHQIALTQIRAVAGAQFTAKEAEDFLNRAWNPALPIEENMRRVRLMGETLKAAAQEKDRQSEYFYANGTMKGYKPQTGTSTAALLADFNNRIGFDPRTEPMFTDPTSILRNETQQSGQVGGGASPSGAAQPSVGYSPDRFGINTQGGRF